MFEFIRDDGGWVFVGFKGDIGDCGVWFVVIVIGWDYKEVYDVLFVW